MTIIGLGIDLIEIIRIKKVFSCFGNTFAKRILSKYEWKQYVISTNPVIFLAKRFTVKEAASKALGTGMNYGVTFNQLELYNDMNGKPKMRFFKNALKQYKIMKCRFIHISISDQNQYAQAVVILEN